MKNDRTDSNEQPADEAKGAGQEAAGDKPAAASLKETAKEDATTPAHKGTRKASGRKQSKAAKTSHRDDAKNASQAALDKPAAAAGAGETSKKRGRKAGLLIAILALLLAGGSAVGLYLLQQQSLQHDLALSSSIDELRDELKAGIDANRQQLSGLETLKQELGTLRADVDNAAAVRQRIEAEQQALNAALAEMQARLGRTTVAWRLAEVEYLLIVANTRLSLEHDRNTALVALQTADQKLRAIGDPAFVPVRQTIAREITALKAVQMPDITGMALRLGSLAEAVQDLPLLDTQVHGPGPAVESSKEDYKSLDWSDIPGAVWKDIRGLVVIRRTDRPIEPLLPPAQEWYLRQNLQLKLEQARFSLLRQQTALFRHQIGEARGWLEAWFDNDASAVKSLVAALDELGKVDLQPQLPDISESLRVLRGHMQRLGAEVEPAQREGGEQ